MYIEKSSNDLWDYNPRKYRKVVNKGEKRDNLLNKITEYEENIYWILILLFGFYIMTGIHPIYQRGDPNNLYLAGVIINFPDYNKVLENNAIESPLMDLVKGNIYIINIIGEFIELKLEFLKEYYYPSATA